MQRNKRIVLTPVLFLISVVLCATFLSVIFNVSAQNAFAENYISAASSVNAEAQLLNTTNTDVAHKAYVLAIETEDDAVITIGESSDSNSQKLPGWAIAVIVLAVGFVAVMLAAGFAWFYLKKKKNKNN